MTRLLLCTTLFCAAGVWVGLGLADVGRPSTADAAIPSPSTAGPPRDRATTPTATIDEKGRLWLAWVEDGRVMVARSDDAGRTFQPAVAATPAPEDIEANGESRPSLVVDDRHVFVAWTRKGAKPYTGDIRFAASDDGGMSYSTPRTVNDDGIPTGHRFQSMDRLPDGRLLIAWIDKRDLERAKQTSSDYAGAALYYTVSNDNGRTFATNRKIKDHVCECCRLSLTTMPDGTPAVLYRDIFDGQVRDHALALLHPGAKPPDVRRVTQDGWAIQACPHHGPALAVAADGTLHMAWFTGASPDGPGQFYARSTDEGRTFTGRRRLGTEDSLGHPDLAVTGSDVTIAWKDRDAAGTPTVRVERSTDAGRTWADPYDALIGSGSTDHPQLLVRDGRVLLGWFTTGEGYRLLPLPPTAGASE
jgi:hypothetical protein